jgi:hypothetical protein
MAYKNSTHIKLKILGVFENPASIEIGHYSAS